MSNRALLPMLRSQSILAASAPSYKIQLPARTFQILARSSKTAPKCRAAPTRLSWLHTARPLADSHQTFEHHVQKIKPQHGTQQHLPAHQTSNIPLSSDAVGNEHSVIRKTVARDHELINKTGFRKYMRWVSHPVAIVTSTDTGIDINGGPQSWRGATVSSFNSVALHPEPYVSFNIKSVSSTFDAIRNSNLFAVHLMSETAHAVEISAHFSRGNETAPFFLKDIPSTTSLKNKLQPFVCMKSQWSLPISLEDPRAIPPILQYHTHGYTRAVMFQMLCEYQADKTVEIGDHVIVIGKVLFTKGVLEDRIEQQNHSSPVPKHCLMYSNGKYIKSVREEFRSSATQTAQKSARKSAKVDIHTVEEEDKSALGPRYTSGRVTRDSDELPAQPAHVRRVKSSNNNQSPESLSYRPAPVE